MDYGAGPRAAPLIQGGQAYCLSALGELFCFRLADGRIAWQRSLARDYQQKTPTWGYTASPLWADGKLLVNPGGRGGPIAALDPALGAQVWVGAGLELNYASFLVGTFGGVSQAVGYDRKTAGGWDIKTGRRIWTLEVPSNYGYLVPSPVAVGGKLLLTSDQDDAHLLDFQPGGQIDPAPKASNADVAPDVSTPTVWGDTILCASAGLTLLDASPDGKLKTLWTHDSEECVRGVCHAIVSNDRALVMCADGQVLLLAFDRQTCKILDRHKLCDRTLAHPALAGGRFYVRDGHKLACYAMASDSE
jgi:outer membrane protein assembly factor BamB